MTPQEVADDILRVTGTNIYACPGQGILLLDFLLWRPGPTPDPNQFRFNYAIRDEDGLQTITYPNDITVNHRYQNKNYCTVSQKNGRKVAKYGYVIIEDLDMLNHLEYIADVRREGESFHENRYLVNLHLDEKHPCAHLVITEQPYKAMHTVVISKNADNGWIETDHYCNDEAETHNHGGNYFCQTEEPRLNESVITTTYAPYGEAYFAIEGRTAEQVFVIMD